MRFILFGGIQSRGQPVKSREVVIEQLHVRVQLGSVFFKVTEGGIDVGHVASGLAGRVAPCKGILVAVDAWPPFVTCSLLLPTQVASLVDV